MEARTQRALSDNEQTLNADAASRIPVPQPFSLRVPRQQGVYDVLIAMDRQERGQGSLSAVQELKQSLGIPVSSIIQLNDLIDILEESEEYAEYLDPVVDYRRKYGVLS